MTHTVPANRTRNLDASSAAPTQRNTTAPPHQPITRLYSPIYKPACIPTDFSFPSSSPPNLPTPMTAPIPTPSSNQHRPARIKTPSQPHGQPTSSQPNTDPNPASDADITFHHLPSFDTQPLWPHSPEQAEEQRGIAGPGALMSSPMTPRHPGTGGRPRRHGRARELVAVRCVCLDRGPRDQGVVTDESAREVDTRVREVKARTGLARWPDWYWSLLLRGEGEGRGTGGEGEGGEGLVVGGPREEGEGWMAWAGRGRGGVV